MQAANVKASCPIVAEALAMREAVTMAANFSITKVIFESDNLDLVQACRGRKQVGIIHGIIKDIAAQITHLEEYRFT